MECMVDKYFFTLAKARQEQAKQYQVWLNQLKTQRTHVQKDLDRLNKEINRVEKRLNK